jgi:hypothetical protein
MGTERKYTKPGVACCIVNTLVILESSLQTRQTINKETKGACTDWPGVIFLSLQTPLE